MILLFTLGCVGAPSPEAARVDLPVAHAVAPPALGIPYGYWGLNGFLTPEALAPLAPRIRLGVVQTATVDPAYATTRLFPLIKAAGLRVTLRMTGDHPRYTRDGDFDLAAWTAMLQPWRAVDLRPWIADGTFAGHMLLDDIDTFDGHDPTAAELDEMARLSHEYFPGLLTFVRERATEMPTPTGGRYQHVDAVVNQYKVLDGDVVAFAADTAARAAALDLGVINGLNLADGGDGTSGQRGWRDGRFAMSAAEIRRYGAVMLAVPSCGMFLNWEYDGQERWSDGSIGAAWLARPDVEAALAELGDAAARHPSVKLLRPR